MILILSYDNIGGIHFPVGHKQNFNEKFEQTIMGESCAFVLLYTSALYIYYFFLVPKWFACSFFILINWTQKQTTL